MSEWLIELHCELTANHLLLWGYLTDCPMVTFMQGLALVLTGIWLAKATIQTWLAARWRRRAEPFSAAVDTEVWRAYRMAGRGVGLRRLPPLLKSDRHRYPALAAGIFRPMVFLSPRLAANLEPAELEAVLTHELIHIKRADNLLIRFWELVFAAMPVAIVQFFAMAYPCEPAYRGWANGATVVAILLLRYLFLGWFRATREFTCDDGTVAITGKPLILASALLKAWHWIRDRGAVLTVAAQRPGYLLFTGGVCVEGRIQRLLNYRAPRFQSIRGLLWQTVLALLLLWMGGFAWEIHVNHRCVPTAETCQALANCVARP